MGTLDIGKVSGTLAPNRIENIPERAHFSGLYALTGSFRHSPALARAEGLCGGIAEIRHDPRKDRKQYGCKVSHGMALYCPPHELRMNGPARVRSANLDQYTHTFGRSNRPYPADSAQSSTSCMPLLTREGFEAKRPARLAPPTTLRASLIPVRPIRKGLLPRHCVP
jgi:hypothetical protein